MPTRLSDDVLKQLFLDARTHNAWAKRDVPDQALRDIVDIMKAGPTSANSQPVRILFLRSPAAKKRLEPFLSAGNHDKTMAAPVTALIAHDLHFYEHLPRLFPHNQEARSWFEGKDAVAQTTAVRNGTLQGAYFMIAARAVGLDVGAMSGFDNAGADKEFFPDGRVKSNFLCNVGYGDPAGLFQRSPRPSFDDIAKIL